MVLKAIVKKMTCCMCMQDRVFFIQRDSYHVNAIWVDEVSICVDCIHKLFEKKQEISNIGWEQIRKEQHDSSMG